MIAARLSDVTSNDGPLLPLHSDRCNLKVRSKQLARSCECPRRKSIAEISAVNAIECIEETQVGGQYMHHDEIIHSHSGRFFPPPVLSRTTSDPKHRTTYPSRFRSR